MRPAGTTVKPSGRKKRSAPTSTTPLAPTERHAAIAKAHLTDLYDRTVRVTTELHGGIGFTWEYDLHLWFRRALFDRAFLGEAGHHRRRAADLAGW